MTLILALAIVLGTAVGTIGFGRRSNPAPGTMAGWAVGGRRFSTVLFWFMNAGEVYTTFAVLGISGYAWALGAPAYLAFTSVSLSYCVGYWLMPKIWRSGRKHGLLTQADFFAARYDSRWLGAVTAVVGIAALVVYVQIQLVSLSLIVRLTLGGSLSPNTAVVIGALVMLAFVYLAGLRSAAFASGVKDVLMIVIMLLLTATVASRVGASSFLDIFHLAEKQHPGIGKFPGIDPHSPTTSVWLITSGLNVALGNWVFPHLFQVSYSASSGTSIRRNAIWQPLYSLAYFFIILLGFAALVAGTKPAGGDLNGAFLQFVSDKYPSWIIGIVAGTGFLLALAPGSVLILTSGSLFARNVVGAVKSDLTDRATLLISRLSMTGFAAVAVLLTVSQNKSMVDILIYAYSAIGMLAPGVFLAFLWRRTSAVAVFLGIVAGFVALLAPFAKHYWAAHLPQWEPGVIAMAINAAVVLAVSLVTPQPKDEAAGVGLDLSARSAGLPTAARLARQVSPATGAVPGVEG